MASPRSCFSGCSGQTIREAMQRAEKLVCLPGDTRCYGFPYGVNEALATRTPSGWVNIGWVVADTGRKSWDAWYHLATGEGRLKRQQDP